MVQLHLPGYEGPLQLLLDLIEKQELDISELSLVQVADQYLDQLQQLEARSANELPAAITEFILIGSKLMLLKSQAMLPRDPESLGEDEEDVGRELVDMLEEYQRYRDAVGVLGTIDKSGMRSFRPSAPPPVETPAPKGLPENVTLDLLTDLVREALQRAEREQKLHPEVALQRDVVTVKDKIAELTTRLRSGRRVSFRAWIAEARTRVEVIVTFMAILELFKGRQIEMTQDETYGDILVEQRSPAAPPARDDTPSDEPNRDPQPPSSDVTSSAVGAPGGDG